MPYSDASLMLVQRLLYPKPVQHDRGRETLKVRQCRSGTGPPSKALSIHDRVFFIHQMVLWSQCNTSSQVNYCIHRALTLAAREEPPGWMVTAGVLLGRIHTATMATSSHGEMPQGPHMHMTERCHSPTPRSFCCGTEAENAKECQHPGFKFSCTTHTNTPVQEMPLWPQQNKARVMAPLEEGSHVKCAHCSMGSVWVPMGMFSRWKQHLCPR